MESGPDALLGLILLRSLCTPRTSTTISGIEGITSPGGVGMVVVSSTENTEVNCRFSVSALDWLSENSHPPSLSGDIPVLSQRLALTNFQKGLVSFSCMWNPAYPHTCNWYYNDPNGHQMAVVTWDRSIAHTHTVGEHTVTGLVPAILSEVGRK